MTEGTRLYPKRVSEQIGDLGFRLESSVNLSEVEKRALLAFEEGLFERLQELSEVKDEDVVSLYPGFFLTDRGHEFLDQLIGSSGLKERQYQERDLNKLVPLLGRIDFLSVDENLQTEIEHLSSEWAMENFKREFASAGGDVEKIEDPVRVCFVKDKNAFLEKIKGLRELKRIWKEMRGDLRDDESSLGRAKRVVLDMYNRLLNVKIARRYPFAALLLAGGQLTPVEEEILKNFALPSEESGRSERLPAGRFIERIDHFLQGTGLEIGPNGLFVSYPNSLRDYALSLLDFKEAESEDWRLAQSFVVSPNQIKVLVDGALEIGGFGGWKSEIASVRDGLKVSYNKESGGKVRIPESENRKLGEVLVVIEHELAHILRRVNRQSLEGKTLRIISDLVGGRGGALNEGVSKWIESKAKEIMFGMKSLPEPYYLLAISEKANGGSFKDCFRVFLEAYARKNFGLGINELLTSDHKIEFDEAFNYVYPRVLRLFRRWTSLSDKSGYVPDTRQLKYLEGYLVVDALQSMDFFNLAFVKGLDLNSIPEILYLGMIDINSIRGYDFPVSRQIWLRLKKVLQGSGDLDCAIRSLPQSNGLES